MSEQCTRAKQLASAFTWAGAEETSTSGENDIATRWLHSPPRRTSHDRNHTPRRGSTKHRSQQTTKKVNSSGVKEAWAGRVSKLLHSTPVSEEYSQRGELFDCIVTAEGFGVGDSKSTCPDGAETREEAKAAASEDLWYLLQKQPRTQESKNKALLGGALLLVLARDQQIRSQKLNPNVPLRATQDEEQRFLTRYSELAKAKLLPLGLRFPCGDSSIDLRMLQAWVADQFSAHRDFSALSHQVKSIVDTIDDEAERPGGSELATGDQQDAPPLSAA